MHDLSCPTDIVQDQTALQKKTRGNIFLDKGIFSFNHKIETQWFGARIFPIGGGASNILF